MVDLKPWREADHPARGDLKVTPADVRVARIGLGWSQAKMARYFGYDNYEFIGWLEAGRTSTPVRWGATILEWAADARRRGITEHDRLPIWQAETNKQRGLELRRKVAAWLRERPTATNTEIAKHLGVTGMTVGRHRHAIAKSKSWSKIARTPLPSSSAALPTG